MAIVAAMLFDYRHELKEAEICNAALARASVERIVDTEENTKQARFSREHYPATRDELFRIFPANFAVRYVRCFRDEAYPFPLDDGRAAYKLERWRTLTGTVVDGSAVVTAIPAADRIFLAEDIIDMEASGTGIRDGSRVISFDAVAGTITLDRPASAAGTSIALHLPVMKVLEVNYDRIQPFERIGAGDLARVLTEASSGYDSAEKLEYLDVKVVLKVTDPDLFDSLFRNALILYLAMKAALPLAADKGKYEELKSEFSSMLASASYSSSEERQVEEPEGFWSDRRVGGGPSTKDRR